MSESQATAAVDGRRNPLTTALVALLAVAALVIAGSAGWLLHGADGPGAVAESSVDAGFARDMAAHHVQAVTMAAYERDHTTNDSLRLLAYDIEESQQFELGLMSGWLDAWGLSRQSKLPVMGWMGTHDAMPAGTLMPGMATPEQMDRLQTLTGTELDVLFLQLMIHHHQGGLPMAEYALRHAKRPEVRTAAKAMITVQSNEIIVMERQLRELGGSPLPPPDH